MLPLHGSWVTMVRRRLTEAAVSGAERETVLNVRGSAAASRILPLTALCQVWAKGRAGGISIHTSVEPIRKKGPAQGVGSDCQSAYPNKTGVGMVVAAHYGGMETLQTALSCWCWGCKHTLGEGRFSSMEQHRGSICLYNIWNQHSSWSTWKTP